MKYFLLKQNMKPLWFVLFWLAINLLQSAFTELTSDEGYYWFYSLHLQWGYYDHPPLLALLIKAGYFLFRNEFGVRLLYVILNASSLLIFINLLPPGFRKKNYPYFIIAAMPLLHYISFIVFPDGPLLFFTACFLWSYKKFLSKPGIHLSILLGLIMSLMLYSKYHAVLVIGFTLISNLSLLKNRYFYAAILIAGILFIPHLVWQFNNDFITFHYHLHQREGASSSNRVFEYISQQVLAIGPAFIFVPFVYRVKDQFEKTLLYLTLGTFAFFLVASINTFVHFHWTSIAIFPILYMAVKYYHDKKRKTILWLLLPFFIISLLFRVQLISTLLPVNHVGVDYYDGRKNWGKEIHELAGNSPVVFENNFRESSLYSFYSGQMGVALFSGENRKTQYDLWHYEDSLQFKNVYLQKRDSFPGCMSMQTSLGKKFYYVYIPRFQSFYNIKVTAQIPQLIPAGTNATVEIAILNPRKDSLLFIPHDGVFPSLYCRMTGKQTVTEQQLFVFPVSNVIPGGIFKFHVTLNTAGLPEGKYSLSIGFKSPPLQDSFNSAYTFRIQ
ncbi:MAG: glycosyltransferase family 39 protein [Ginsengibacter sp.]